MLCAPGATVIWTRHCREPDLGPRVCSWFAEEGFELERLTREDFTVGVHRYTGPARPLEPGLRMFTF
ncbi:hypothetical protein AB0K48_57265 [Nonomuraea sp. NPDC055795]